MKIPFIILFFGLILSSSNQTHPASFSYDDEKFYKGQTKTLDLIYGTGETYQKRSIEIVDSLYFFLKKHQELKIEIAAYSICRGSERYNLALTERRARQLKQFLREKGIDENRLFAKGYGRFLFKDCQDCNECKEEKVEITNGLVEVILL
ncbi:OmpA family protein [Bernardetia sp. Wsw4-3y2]|uniref:OmpA family protein n=1 Tax=Bernardetia sp. Wsw4-3y2 TaxID=3127471 RepID=UPI0030CBD609